MLGATILHVHTINSYSHERNKDMVLWPLHD